MTLLHILFRFDSSNPWINWLYNIKFLLFVWNKVDPGKPASLTWQRMLNDEGSAISQFTLSLKEIVQMVCLQIWSLRHFFFGPFQPYTSFILYIQGTRHVNCFVERLKTCKINMHICMYIFRHICMYISIMYLCR